VLHLASAVRLQRRADGGVVASEHVLGRIIANALRECGGGFEVGEEDGLERTREGRTGCRRFNVFIEELLERHCHRLPVSAVRREPGTFKYVKSPIGNARDE
jgi:hypothetical protein